eukprot:2729469-Rhodomonas_salina.3
MGVCAAKMGVCCAWRQFCPRALLQAARDLDAAKSNAFRCSCVPGTLCTEQELFWLCFRRAGFFPRQQHPAQRVVGRAWRGGALSTDALRLRGSLYVPVPVCVLRKVQR